MPKKVLFNLMISCFLFAFLFAANVFAQTNSCAMSLGIVQNDGETEIKGATATAVNSKTKKIYNSVLKAGMPYFAKLPEGDYKITVSKVGFKRSVGNFVHDCSETDAIAFQIELYKGNSRQIVDLNKINADKYSEGTENVPSLRSEAVISSNNQASASGENGSQTSQQDNNTPKTISGGVINGKAINLVKPAYPAAARAVRASGAVNVQVTIDEQGNVISAAAVSGHPLLRAAAVKAARESKFPPTLLSGQPVKVTGVIVYNFVP